MGMCAVTPGRLFEATIRRPLVQNCGLEISFLEPNAASTTARQRAYNKAQHHYQPYISPLKRVISLPECDLYRIDDHPILPSLDLPFGQIAAALVLVLLSTPGSMCTHY